jgi:hypothetical protein
LVLWVLSSNARNSFNKARFIAVAAGLTADLNGDDFSNCAQLSNDGYPNIATGCQLSYAASALGAMSWYVFSLPKILITRLKWLISFILVVRAYYLGQKVGGSVMNTYPETAAEDREGGKVTEFVPTRHNPPPMSDPEF